MTPKAHILYVEDDVNLSFVTSDNLELAQFAVTHCLSGADAWAAFQRTTFDLCILDVMLPGIDGFTLAKQIRAGNATIPILFLSARADKIDRLAGLRLGADDYLTKPFSIEELILKIEIFLRRTAGLSTLPPTREVPEPVRVLGNYQFHTQNLTLTHAVQTQTLTRREADVLHYLIDRPNTLIRRDELLKAIWGDDDYFMGRSLDVFISRLRKHLRHDPAIRIDNLHGVGFRLTN